MKLKFKKKYFNTLNIVFPINGKKGGVANTCAFQNSKMGPFIPFRVWNLPIQENSVFYLPMHTKITTIWSIFRVLIEFWISRVTPPKTGTCAVTGTSRKMSTRDRQKRDSSCLSFNLSGKLFFTDKTYVVYSYDVQKHSMVEIS